MQALVIRPVMIGTCVAALLLGLGSCRNRTLEVTVPARPSKPAIVAEPAETALGSSHSCALHDSGQVFCWGENQSGQVGDLSLGNLVSIPTRVPGVDNAVQIAVDGDDTCARTTTGEIWCWGALEPPTRVEGLAKPAADMVVCEGTFGFYGCALHDGEVSCWGRQFVNNPDGTPLLPSDTAVVIPNLHDASALACDAEIACARRGHLDALCWGAVEGEGLVATSAVVEPVPLPAFHARQSPTSGFGTMSSCRDGACWSLEPRKDDETFSLSGIQTIANSQYIECTLRNDGQVNCKGPDDFGMRGNTDASGTLLGISAHALAVGERHACVLDKEHGILCWGDNEKAQLGDGTWGDAVPVPQKLADVSRPRDLKASRRWIDWPMRSVMPLSLSKADREGLKRMMDWQWRGIAVTSEQQLVWWGGTREAKISSKSPSMTRADLNGEGLCASTKEGLVCAALSEGDLAWKRVSAQQFDQLSAGGHHFCGRDDAGLAWCWGSSEKGAIGDGDSTDRATPVRVQGLGTIAKIASGDAHSCALDLEGKVSCWGKNNQGRLGDGTSESRRAPVAVVGLDDAVDLSVGKDTSCVVRKNGNVSCWGRLFTGMRMGLQTVVVEPARNVSVGCDHACSISNAGVVQCWGSNEHGQLGAVPGTLENNPDGESRGPLWMQSYFGPSTVAELPPAKRIVAGCSGTCAETVAGEVYCWGHRSTIGDGLESFRAKARPIADPLSGWPKTPPSGT